MTSRRIRHPAEAQPTGLTEQLPARDAMSRIDADVAIPVNAAIAANVLSDHATASPVASQQAGIDQDA